MDASQGGLNRSRECRQQRVLARHDNARIELPGDLIEVVALRIELATQSQQGSCEFRVGPRPVVGPQGRGEDEAVDRGPRRRGLSLQYSSLVLRQPDC